MPIKGLCIDSYGKESIRSNINLDKIWMKDAEWKGTTIGLPLNNEKAIILARGLLEAVESSEDSITHMTIFPRRKHPTITISFDQSDTLRETPYEEQ
jgi:hypothetical protein